ncbi:sugar kinase [Sphingobacterium sp. SGG-5]|uniref:sugar kinase n=1 Tax=Sphingobacterium sp. SGG-5 TaxID=2710881 RepID=UPI0013EE361D|nr:sugar kinase [Sphingobacterium sp. SGG-5]NGM60335.1 sugar kinase [Sphingobacterium sp. SGG-5]
MDRVLCFGEILLRQQALGNSFFENHNNLLRIYPGGSEANVAVSLSLMGTPTSYFSAFPKHALSDEIISTLDALHIDTSKIVIYGDRIGSYILLSSNGLTKGEVIYDRKYSSFSLLTLKQLDFDKLFDGVDWFHWTALTPALNSDMGMLMETILAEANKRKVKISVDLNYRNKLWQYGKEPIEVMPQLVRYCDVVMGNIWAANKMLGTSIDDTLHRHTSTAEYVAYATKSADEIFEKFPKVKHIANTFRFMDNPQHNFFYGTYHTPEHTTVSQLYETHAVVDRIGSGDAFMGGLIHALKNNKSPQEVIDTATGAGYQKLFVAGDFGNGKYE